MSDEFFFQGIHAVIWILQGSMFSFMFGGCMNWCKTSSSHGLTNVGSWGVQNNARFNKSCEINSLSCQCLADQILGLCFCLLPQNFYLVLRRFDSILLGSSFVSQPGIWMSFLVPVCKWAFGTLFHGFAPYLLWCFSLSEPCNLRYLSVLKSSSSTHPVPKAVTHNCRLVLEAMVLGFCGCLYRLFSKEFPQPHGPNSSQASWQPLFRPTLRLCSADATVATIPTIRACSSGSHQRQDTEPCEGYPRGSSTRTRSSA